MGCHSRRWQIFQWDTRQSRTAHFENFAQREKFNALLPPPLPPPVLKRSPRRFLFNEDQPDREGIILAGRLACTVRVCRLFRTFRYSLCGLVECIPDMRPSRLKGQFYLDKPLSLQVGCTVILSETSTNKKKLRTLNRCSTLCSFVLSFNLSGQIYLPRERFCSEKRSRRTRRVS